MDISIVVVSTISEWVNCCNTTSGNILDNRAYAPGIVRVLNNNLSILVDNGNNVALQVLLEVEWFIIEDNTADRLFIIVERNECIISPSLAQNLGSVKGVGMLYSANCFGRPDSVCIVGILKKESIKIFGWNILLSQVMDYPLSIHYDNYLCRFKMSAHLF